MSTQPQPFQAKTQAYKKFLYVSKNTQQQLSKFKTNLLLGHSPKLNKITILVSILSTFGVAFLIKN